MEKTLEYQIRTSICSLSGDNFQAFICKLFHIAYADDFQQTRRTKDMGCDGFLNRNTVIAVYGPEKIDSGRFTEKVKADYKKYCDNWKNNYPNWLFVINCEASSEMSNAVFSLGQNARLIELNGIMALIDGLTHGKKCKVMNALQIPEQYYVYDLLKEVVSDLVQHEESISRVSQVSRPPYVLDKIRKNFANQADIDASIQNYFDCAGYFGQLEKILKAYDDAKISSLKNKISTAYSSLTGTHKERLNQLQTAFGHPGDDFYNFYVRVVLMYCFEICLIGARVGEEDDS